MSSPRNVSPPHRRREGDYAPVDTDVAGECRRLLGCNVAIAMLCVLFTICCLVVTVILDPVTKVKDAPQRPVAVQLAPSPATESWDPGNSDTDAAETTTRQWPKWPSWPHATTTVPKPKPTTPPMVLITGPPEFVTPREEEKSPSFPEGKVFIPQPTAAGDIV